MEVKFKKLVKGAIIPTYAKNGDAGMDLTATSKWYDDDNNVCYGTGLAIEIPKGYVGFVFPRSSNAKKDVILSNCVGVIDSGYRGEITFKYKFIDNRHFAKDYNVGDRVGQIIIMPYPSIEFVEVDELSKTERGEGGYGSSGK